MRTRQSVLSSVVRKYPAVLAAVAVALLCGAPLAVRAGPTFAFPDPGATHPGLVPLLSSPGPTPLLLGGTLGPALFLDTVAGPSVGHWEIEIKNAFGMPPIPFNVTLLFPGGPVSGSLTLPPVSSMYFDIGYLDAPELGFWAVSAASSISMPGSLLIDTDTFEIPIPGGHGPGLAATVPAGGAIWGAPIGGPAPGVTLTLASVPEPSTFILLGIGVAGYALRRTWQAMRRTPPR